MAEIPTFKGSWHWPWIESYCIPSCVSHRPLPTYQISLKSKKLFVDKRTYRRADRHLRPNFIRLTQRSWPKKATLVKNTFVTSNVKQKQRGHDDTTNNLEMLIHQRWISMPVSPTISYTILEHLRFQLIIRHNNYNATSSLSQCLSRRKGKLS